MHRKHTFFFVIPCLMAVVFTGFSSCKKGNENPHPDISDVPEQKVSIVRLDQLLWQAGADNYPAVFGTVETQYPDIFKSYAQNFWGLVNTDSLHPVNPYDSLYHNVVSNPWMNRLRDSVMVIYSSLSDVEKELSTSFRYFKYYFPDSSLPQLYSYIGPFVYWTLFDDNALGIELDMYMGKHFGYYGDYENNIPEYISTRCDKPYIAVNVMQSLMDGNIFSLGPESTLLDEMVRQGKMLYYLDCVLPDKADSTKMGYTEEQIEWCDANKGEIWKFLAGEDLLFSKKIDDLRRYVGEAPTSVGMPDNAPGRVAVWMGWQIVRSYMQEHPSTTLQQLFAMPDALQLLKDSGFNAED